MEIGLKTRLVAAASLALVMLTFLGPCFLIAQSQDQPQPTIKITSIDSEEAYPRDSPRGKPINLAAQVFTENQGYYAPFNAQDYPVSLQVVFEATGHYLDKMDQYLSPAMVDLDSVGLARTVFYPPTQASFVNYSKYLGYVPFNATCTIWAHLQRVDDNEKLSSTSVKITVFSGNPTSPSDESDDTSSWSPCIIATATYGSVLAPQVVFMRSVRDDMIGSSTTGKVLVSGWNRFYYSWSPPIAQAISGSQSLRGVFSVVLSPLLGLMHVVAADYSSIAWLSPDVAAVHAFLSAAVLSIGIYLVLPGFLLWFGVDKVRGIGRSLESR